MADRKIHSGDGIDSGFLKWRVEKASCTYTATGRGAQATDILFTVTGLVAVRYIFGVCNTDLVGAATMDLGTVSDDDFFSEIQLADVTTWDQNEIWGSVAQAAAPSQSIILTTTTSAGLNKSEFMLVNSENIIQTVAAADITAGQINWYCIWASLKSGATLTGVNN